jgi:hypothetical protein
METNNDQPVFSGIEEALAYQAEDEKKKSDSVATTTDKEEPEEDDSVLTDETETEEPEPEDSEEQPEGEDDEEEGTDKEDDEDFLFSIEDDQGEFKVKNAEEAKKGYMRQRQFTKVTQEVAAERKELQNEKASLLEAKSQYLTGVQDLKIASSAKLAEFVTVDWEALQQEDPVAFDEQKSRYEAAKLSYEQANAAEQQVSNEVQRETIEYAQTVRADEMQRLVAVVPEIAEEGSTLLKDATKSATELYGFSQDELFSIYDHRQIRAIIDAYRYNEVKGKLNVGKAKAKSAKTTIKPKGTASPRKTQAKKAQSVQDRLNAPGGVSLAEAMKLLG